AFFDGQGSIVDAAGKLAHLVTQYRPQADGQCRPGDKEATAQEPALAFQGLIMSDEILVQPFIDICMAAKDQAKQDHKSDDPDGDDGRGDRFRDPAEGYYKAAHGQGYSGKEEHGRVRDKQEVHAVLQEC